MNYQTLERTIGHSFADIALLDLAMTHPSYALQHKCQDNQRLEFLGDAVLEICVSRVLYHKYPKLREGQLTRKRAALVCEANLARAATRLGLGSYLKLDRGEEVVGGRENPSILADTMEAVIAAVYLDAGMEEAAKLVDLAMDGYETSEKNDRDAKSALQEYLQALGEETPTYEIIGQDGPPHARVFTARVLRADGSELGTGVGAGVVIGGNVIAGAHGAAGEIGHLNVEPEETETCNCGCRGCLEQYASARGLIRLYREECEADGAEPVAIAHATDALAVVEAARGGNTQAVRACERLGRYLARALAAVAVTVDPDAFVVGGGMSGGWDTFGRACLAHYREVAVSACKDTPIRPASLGNDAGFLGAARRALLSL